VDREPATTSDGATRPFSALALHALASLASDPQGSPRPNRAVRTKATRRRTGSAESRMPVHDRKAPWGLPSNLRGTCPRRQTGDFSPVRTCSESRLVDEQAKPVIHQGPKRIGLVKRKVARARPPFLTRRPFHALGLERVSDTPR